MPRREQRRDGRLFIEKYLDRLPVLAEIALHLHAARLRQRQGRHLHEAAGEAVDVLVHDGLERGIATRGRRPLREVDEERVRAPALRVHRRFELPERRLDLVRRRLRLRGAAGEEELVLVVALEDPVLVAEDLARVALWGSHAGSISRFAYRGTSLAGVRQI